jgi:hypothetical protein
VTSERISAGDIRPGDRVARSRTHPFRRVEAVEPLRRTVRLHLDGAPSTRPAKAARWWREVVPGETRDDRQAQLAPQRAYRETPEVVEAVCRMVRSVGKRVAEEDTDGLEQLRAVQAALDDAWATGINGLRRTYSDGAIARELGITRQAVQQRWPRSTEAA